MEAMPQLESCLRLSFEARDGERHPSGVLLASYFVRAPTRGRRRTELDPEVLFPRAVRARLGPAPDRAIALAMDPATYRSCAGPLPTIPLATREWLGQAALALGKGEGFDVVWSLLRAVSELESVAQRLLGARMPRAVVRQVLHGVDARSLRVEPFAALLVRVLKIAQAVYGAFRHAGLPHEVAWAAVEDRLWSPHPTGDRAASGARAIGPYLPSLVQAASGNARRRIRRNAEAGRTREHAHALLARFASGPGVRLWPWSDAAGLLLPQGDGALSPEVAGFCFFVLLTQAASERRARGGPSRGLSPPFADAGFGNGEWLPDRTDDLAIRLLAAGADEPIPRGELLDALSVLVRATLSSGADGVALTLQRLGVDLAQGEEEAVLDRARARLPHLLRWLEENGRELLET
ncbi:MAG: hypothetical protein ACJ79H_18915 [Myxococcales bacterium]